MVQTFLAYKYLLLNLSRIIVMFTATYEFVWYVLKS